VWKLQRNTVIDIIEEVSLKNTPIIIFNNGALKNKNNLYTLRLLLLSAIIFVFFIHYFINLRNLKIGYKRNPLGIQTTGTQFTKLEIVSITHKRLIKD
jgi:hypothetical protein